MTKMPCRPIVDAIYLVAGLERVLTIVRWSCIRECVEGVGAGAGSRTEVGITVRFYEATTGAYPRRPRDACSLGRRHLMTVSGNI